MMGKLIKIYLCLCKDLAADVGLLLPATPALEFDDVTLVIEIESAFDESSPFPSSGQGEEAATVVVIVELFLLSAD